MTDLSVPRQSTGLRPSRATLSAIAALALVAMADWLFYGRPVGVSWAAFVLALAAAVWTFGRRASARRASPWAVLILAASLLPTVEHFGLLALLSSLAGLAIFALLVTGRFAGSAAERGLNALWLFVAGPSRLARDTRRHAGPTLRRMPLLKGEWLLAWFVPLALGVVFLSLFASANPVIEGWLSAVRFESWLGSLDVRRILYWLFIAALVWPFLRVRVGLGSRLARFPLPRLDFTGLAQAPSALFGRRAILRSLVLFNALFAVQSVLDLTYLWGGVALPEGMSYAAYAHRGAYPLIATALLAAAFVLATMRPGSDTERDPLVRALVFAWVGQNVLLVLSSILRLDLYVEVYALTGLRVAALIWMALVAFGLVLIVVRIAFRRSNGWLIAGNLIALGVTLYVSAFVNFPRLIADFNVSHSLEISGQGVSLDAYHLCRLGPEALPAIERFLAAGEPTSGIRSYLADCAARLVADHDLQLTDWRAWSWRAQRLSEDF